MGEALTEQAEPTFVRQLTTLRTLVDDWDEIGLDSPEQVLGSVFEEIEVGRHGLKDYSPERA